MHTRLALFSIVLLAVLLRLYYLGQTGGVSEYAAWSDVSHYGGIVRENLAHAQFLVTGQWSQIVAAHAIGYPALIAPLNAIGADPVLFRLVQIGIDSAACTLAYLVAREFRLGEYAALAAAAMYAIGQSWAWSAGFILAESLLPAMMLLTLWLLLRLRGEHRTWFWVLAGSVIGIMPTVRTEMAPFIVFVGAWGLFAATGAIRQRIWKSSAAVAGFALVLLAASTTSWAVRGHFGISKNLTWYALYSGLGNIPNPYGHKADDTLAHQALEALGMQYHSQEAEQYWKARYLKAWSDHPEYVVKVIVYRAKKILLDTENFHTDRLRAAMQAALRGALFFALPLALLLLWRRGDWLLAALLVVPPLFAIGTIGLMHWEARYVRYAHLTHLFAWAIVLDALLKFRLPAFARFRF